MKKLIFICSLLLGCQLQCQKIDQAAKLYLINEDIKHKTFEQLVPDTKQTVRKFVQNLSINGNDFMEAVVVNFLQSAFNDYLCKPFKDQAECAKVIISSLDKQYLSSLANIDLRKVQMNVSIAIVSLKTFEHILSTPQRLHDFYAQNKKVLIEELKRNFDCQQLIDQLQYAKQKILQAQTQAAKDQSVNQIHALVDQISETISAAKLQSIKTKLNDKGPGIITTIIAQSMPNYTKEVIFIIDDLTFELNKP